MQREKTHRRVRWNQIWRLTTLCWNESSVHYSSIERRVLVQQHARVDFTLGQVLSGLVHDFVGQSNLESRHDREYIRILITGIRGGPLMPVITPTKSGHNARQWCGHTCVVYAINPGIHAPPSIFTTAHAHPPLTNARGHIQVGGMDRP